MKEPKFGRWTHVNDRLPGRDEKVLAGNPNNGEQVVVTGAELAASADLHLWMPLAPPATLQEAMNQFAASQGLMDDV